MGEKRLPETKEQAVPFRHLPLLPLSSHRGLIWHVATRRLHAIEVASQRKKQAGLLDNRQLAGNLPYQP
jgi:hypothetical protein